MTLSAASLTSQRYPPLAAHHFFTPYRRLIPWSITAHSQGVDPPFGFWIRRTTLIGYSLHFAAAYLHTALMKTFLLYLCYESLQIAINCHGIVCIVEIVSLRDLSALCSMPQPYFLSDSTRSIAVYCNEHVLYFLLQHHYLTISRIPYIQQHHCKLQPLNKISPKPY